MLKTLTVPHPNGREGHLMTFHGDAQDPPEYDGVPDYLAEQLVLDGAAEDCAGVVVLAPVPIPEPEPEPEIEPEPVPDPAPTVGLDTSTDLDHDEEI